MAPVTLGGRGVQGPKEDRGHVESAEEGGDGQELRVNRDGCQQSFIENRLHLLYCIVAFRIKTGDRDT